VVIVDTTVLVDYFQGVRNAHTDWLDTALERQRLGLTDIILCEVLQGSVMTSRRRRSNASSRSWSSSKPAALRMRVTRHVTIAPFGVVVIPCERPSIA
jgi:predicted nucleic acid-binding protein